MFAGVLQQRCTEAGLSNGLCMMLAVVFGATGSVAQLGTGSVHCAHAYQAVLC